MLQFSITWCKTGRLQKLELSNAKIFCSTVQKMWDIVLEIVTGWTECNRVFVTHWWLNIFSGTAGSGSYSSSWSSSWSSSYSSGPWWSGSCMFCGFYSEKKICRCSWCPACILLPMGLFFQQLMIFAFYIFCTSILSFSLLLWWRRQLHAGRLGLWLHYRLWRWNRWSRL